MPSLPSAGNDEIATEEGHVNGEGDSAHDPRGVHRSLYGDQATQDTDEAAEREPKGEAAVVLPVGAAHDTLVQ